MTVSREDRDELPLNKPKRLARRSQNDLRLAVWRKGHRVALSIAKRAVNIAACGGTRRLWRHSPRSEIVDTKVDAKAIVG